MADFRKELAMAVALKKDLNFIANRRDTGWREQEEESVGCKDVHVVFGEQRALNVKKEDIRNKMLR